MSKGKLTTNQLRAAKDLDETIKSLASIKDQLKNYKVGDVYILEEWWDDPNNTIVDETTLGFPKKYMVCHVSDEGIPYLRQLTRKGNPTGETLIPPEAGIVNAINDSLYGEEDTWRFTPDPEQLDSILLQQEFDPTAQQREKSQLYNEINKHNKNAAIPTGFNSFNKIADFFKSGQPGDKFWTAPDKQFVIQSVTKVGREYAIKCTDMNQKTKTFNFAHFHFKRLYKEQPRSFAKESAK